MPLRVFVIFHDRLDERCYETLTPLEFETITFVAVRPDIPKHYNAQRFTRVIKEWELPEYDPSLQALGYCENSVLWHAMRNGLYAPDDVVMFLQWDMVLAKFALAHVMANFDDDAPLFNVTISGTRFTECLPESLVRSIRDSWVGRAGEATGEDTEFLNHRFPLCNLYAVRGRVLTQALEWAMSPPMRRMAEDAAADDAAWEGCLDLHPWKRTGVIMEHAMGLAVGYAFDSCRDLAGIYHPTSHTIDALPPPIQDRCRVLWSAFQSEVTTQPVLPLHVDIR